VIAINIEQGTIEWRQSRLGIVTASRASDMMSRLKNGDPSKACTDYARQLAMERVSGISNDSFETFAMRRGKELEQIAFDRYQVITGNLCDTVGFLRKDEIEAGYSPDGLVGDDGLIEIKCPESSSKMAYLWTTGDVSEYIDQVQFGFWVSGRKWCDVLIYDPRLEPVGMDCLILRQEPDETAIAGFEKWHPEFMSLVLEYESSIRKRAELTGVNLEVSFL
jgi:YqaJ-like viral recombinase domain